MRSSTFLFSTTRHQSNQPGVETMSLSASGTPRATPRVREQARDVVAVMLFSVGVSVALTVCLVVMMTFGQQG